MNRSWEELEVGYIMDVRKGSKGLLGMPGEAVGAQGEINRSQKKVRGYLRHRKKR